MVVHARRRGFEDELDGAVRFVRAELWAEDAGERAVGGAAGE